MKIPRRRRLEARTDYKARFELLKSGKARLVVRKSNRFILAQIVISEGAQDKVITGFTSKDLLQKGWPKEKEGSLKSLQSAYLTGYFIGKKIDGKVKEALFDIGMQRNVHKSRLYAVLKGAIDAGMKIPHDSNALPTEKEFAKNKELHLLMQKLIK